MAITKIQSESLNLADTYAFTGTVTGAGVTNKPAFRVYLGTNMTSVTRNTETKITFDTESYDTDSAFASNKFTVPSGEAGKYHITSMVSMLNSSDASGKRISLYKNGSEVSRGIKHRFISNIYRSDTYSTLLMSADLDLSASDYLEMYVEMSAAGGSGTILAGSQYTVFSGYKLF